MQKGKGCGSSAVVDVEVHPQIQRICILILHPSIEELLQVVEVLLPRAMPLSGGLGSIGDG